MLHDLRRAVRSVSRTPGMTAVIVLSLALGTGANAAVYSAVDALLFRAPDGVAHSETLVDLYTSQVNGATYGSSSHEDSLSLTAVPQLAAVAAIDELGETSLRKGDAIVNARVAAISDDYWDVLGLKPFIGDWRRGDSGASDAIVSFDVWKRLGQDPSIVGRAVTIGGRTYLVAGVAPPRFRGMHLDRLVDVWVRFDAGARPAGRGTRRLGLIARLGPGADLPQLQAALDGLSQRLAHEYPDTNKGTIRSENEPRRFTGVRYSRLDPTVRSRAGLLAGALLGATCLLLLSACVNAGSLLLSRGLARRPELTIKSALGADRARLVRQLLFEALLLALAGTAAGILAAVWTAGAIPALFAPEHASLLATRVEPRVIATALSIGLAAGVLFGMVPALLSTRSLAADALRGDAARLGERPGGARLRMTLVGAQLALSTIFLIESALLTRMVDSALMMDRSVAAGSLVLASIESADPAFRDAAAARLRRLPSVAAAGWVASPPLARPARREFRIDRGATTEFVEFDVNFASREYFSAMQIHLIEGRHFARQDDVGDAQVVMVNEALQQRYFASRAVGRLLTASDGTSVEIVGVVRTQSYRAFEGSPHPMLYYPMSRATARRFSAAIRSRSGDMHIESDVLQALGSMPGATNLAVSSFDDHLSRALATDRLVVTLVAACGIIALGLAVIGVYGVMMDLVRRRTREIGLRIALGARPLQIVHSFVGTTLSPAFAGVVSGLLGAGWLLGFARSLVYGLPSIDTALVLLVAAGLSAVVLAAVVPPARRALRVSPLQALREHP